MASDAAPDARADRDDGTDRTVDRPRPGHRLGDATGTAGTDPDTDAGDARTGPGRGGADATGGPAGAGTGETPGTRPWTLRSWAATLALLGAASAAVLAVLATGGSVPATAVLVAAVAYLTAETWRSGGRFEFEARGARPVGPRDDPELFRALLEVCEATGRPLPTVVVAAMDAPGAMAGYADGEGVIAVHPALGRTVGPTGLRAVLAHELGHLGADTLTDALRSYLPETVGFGAFWLLGLAGRGPTAAVAGSLLYLGLVYADLAGAGPTALGRWARRLRYLISVGVEPLCVAASRYADRAEEYRADAYAARHVPPAAVSEALFRIAAVATGDDDEDVAGPIPWKADRSLPFAAFATHPSIEARAERLGAPVPEWARPYRPHRGRD